MNGVYMFAGAIVGVVVIALLWNQLVVWWRRRHPQPESPTAEWRVRR